VVFGRNQKMKIAVLSKSDSSSGGASRIATELVDQLLGSAHFTDHWTARQYLPSDHPLRPLYGDRLVVNIAIRLGHTLLRKAGAPELWPIERLNPALSTLRGYDIVHVHDISNSLAVQSLAWLAQHRPVIWTLHDCSPFTGGCLYPLDCVRFRNHCGQCPQKGAWPLRGLLDMTAAMHARKRRFASSTRFTAVAPSQWMANLAESSGFFPRPLVISNGIDLDVFRPMDKYQARQQLNLPIDRVLIAICANDLNEIRKGMRSALAVVREAQEIAPVVLMIGRQVATLKQEFPDLEIITSGLIMNRTDMARWYSAADLMLFCSLADNQPLTVMEAMACGTPVVGFETGGVPEIVDHGKNGWLVPTGEVANLAMRIIDILADRVRLRRWSEAAAIKAASEFGWERCLAAHIALYRSLLTGDQSLDKKSGATR
jgi:glycosyltransferase involved in cell wall biosynthesis